VAYPHAIEGMQKNDVRLIAVVDHHFAAEAEPAPLDGADKRGWVDAGFARYGRVADDDMCARRPSSCWLVVL
jgi:hypothetical protein